MQTMYEVDSYKAFRPAGELVINPEFKKFIPKLSDDEYNGLVESLKKEGCRDPIVISGRTIIDGHNRYEICTRYNIPFTTKQMEFANQNDIKIWMIKNQFARRNLTTYQRAKLALFLQPLFLEKAQKNRVHAGRKINDKDKINSIDEAARLAGASTQSAEWLKRIHKHATPEIINALEEEKISITGAYRQMFKDVTFKKYTFVLPTKLVKAISSVRKRPDFQKKLEKALEQLVKELKKA